MKSKNLLPGICLVVLIISEFFLFSANRQKSAALAQLHQTRELMQDLQSQLDDANNSAAADSAAELARLRADNQDIPRLRNRIQQLQSDNAKLKQLLASAHDASLQQQEQLLEIQAQDEQAAEDQQAQAQAAEQTSLEQRDACIANLRLIDAAKQAWALDKNKTDTDTPAEQDLLPYLKGGVFPVCPSGGVYTIGAVGQLPTCSIPGHALPPR